MVKEKKLNALDSGKIGIERCISVITDLVQTEQ